jgi:hypothetical protein
MAKKQELTNFDKFGTWLKWAFYAALSGALVGALVVPNPINRDDMPAVGAMMGATFAGVLPAIVAGWFLVLHMIGQTAEAVRGSRGPNRRQQRDDDDEEAEDVDDEEDEE